MTDKPPSGAPWAPVEYEDADIRAVRLLSKGTAKKADQIRAFAWLINNACDTYGMSYRPEAPYDTAFAEGKRFVGNQIIKLTKL